MPRSSDGSVYQRKSGDGRWVGSFEVGDGKPRKYVYAKTKREAKEKLKKAKSDHERGRLVAATPETLAVYLPEWLRVYCLTNDLKPSTRTTYQQRARQILARFGTTRLQKLTAQMIETWLVDLLESGLAAKTVRGFYTLLAQAMREAFEKNLIAYNPCERVRLPKVQKYTGEVLTSTQAYRLVQEAQKSRLSCLLTVALATGMRKGELRGLKWSDVDLEKKTLQVSRNISYTANEKGKWGNVETTPKSEAGKRSIDLPQFVVDALREHRKAQREQRMAASRWQDLNLVFCTQEGNYYSLSVLYRQFKRLLRAASLPEIRFHDLRHSAATIFIAMGVNVKVVQELLGHSSVAITMTIYSHVLPGMQREAMDMLDALYRGKEG